MAVITLDDLPRVIRFEQDRFLRRLEVARNEAADESVAPIRKRVPVAFGELEHSIEARHGHNPRVVADAPHAGAVEIGSMPHTPNMERLIAWVKLRGMQGLMSARKLRRQRGTTTAYQASRVAGLLRGMEAGGSVPTNAPELVAKAIAEGIKKHGTRPHWFFRGALPECGAILLRSVRRQLKS